MKNEFDPALRHGYEDYSYYSSYNLLPASMLATALMFMNDSVPQGPSFAETGGFVFSPDHFHKVIANSGGMYAEVEVRCVGRCPAWLVFLMGGIQFACTAGWHVFAVSSGGQLLAAWVLGFSNRR